MRPPSSSSICARTISSKDVSTVKPSARARAASNRLGQPPTIRCTNWSGALRMRAADLIGQLGDPHYLRKANALYYEFEEVGMNKQLGYASPADLTALYPQFYYNSVAPHIQTAIRYLNVTSSGRQWISSLYSNVFRAESELSLSGPER